MDLSVNVGVVGLVNDSRRSSQVELAYFLPHPPSLLPYSNETKDNANVS